MDSSELESRVLVPGAVGGSHRQDGKENVFWRLHNAQGHCAHSQHKYWGSSRELHHLRKAGERIFGTDGRDDGLMNHIGSLHYLLQIFRFTLTSQTNKRNLEGTIFGWLFVWLYICKQRLTDKNKHVSGLSLDCVTTLWISWSVCFDLLAATIAVKLYRVFQLSCRH